MTERLEKLLDEALEDGDRQRAKDIEDELREMYRDISEREAWEREGEDRGWR
jgi:hypothetical protein